MQEHKGRGLDQHRLNEQRGESQVTEKEKSYGQRTFHPIIRETMLGRSTNK